MKKKKTIKVKVKKEDLFNVSVKVLGKIYTTSGATLEKALEKLDIRNPRGLSVWRIEHNGKIREKVLQPFLTANIFKTHGVYREIAIKRFSLLFSNI